MRRGIGAHKKIGLRRGRLLHQTHLRRILAERAFFERFIIFILERGTRVVFGLPRSCEEISVGAPTGALMDACALAENPAPANSNAAPKSVIFVLDIIGFPLIGTRFGLPSRQTPVCRNCSSGSKTLIFLWQVLCQLPGKEGQRGLTSSSSTSRRMSCGSRSAGSPMPAPPGVKTTNRSPA